MKRILALVAVVASIGAVVWAEGPREEVDLTVAFEESAIGPDLDAWLAEREAVFGDITPGTEKVIVWADPVGKGRTNLALIYVHGFSATRQEIAPVPQRVAKALGANLFLTRLAGHGRGSAAMGEPVVNDWMIDMAEAMAIGRLLGDKVVVLGTSTGGTLAVLAAFDEAMRQDLAGLVLVSPNFGVNSVLAPMLTMPFARQILPILAGKERGFEPVNAANETFWTTKYPTISVLPMGALVKAAVGLPFENAGVPALVFISPTDQVVDPAKTRAIVARWAAAHELVEVTMAPRDDAYGHVLAGDILSPGGTEMAVEKMTKWIQATVRG